MSEALKVFISYSRRDRGIATTFHNMLEDRGFQVFRDTEDILPTEAWQDRLSQIIVEADAIVFLLSPDSCTSEICRWEVELATSLNKKLAPIVVRDTPGADIPGMLSRLNYIFATESDPLQNAVEVLADALGHDVEWIREHTRLTALARRWDEFDRHTQLLLGGHELTDAESWLGRRPASVEAPSRICLEFVSESRMEADRVAAYDAAKLAALDRFLQPLLKQELERLEKQQAEQLARDAHYWASTAGMTAASGGAWDYSPYEDQQDQYIRNFLEPDAYWHPQPAVLKEKAAHRANGSDVFEFPCCGVEAVRNTDQFRHDGCENRARRYPSRYGDPDAYAKHRGTDEATVQEWLRTEVISAESGDLIDFKKADALLDHRNE